MVRFVVPARIARFGRDTVDDGLDTGAFVEELGWVVAAEGLRDVGVWDDNDGHPGADGEVDKLPGFGGGEGDGDGFEVVDGEGGLFDDPVGKRGEVVDDGMGALHGGG